MTSSPTGLDELATAWITYLRDEHTPPNTIKARIRTLRAVGNPGTATREEIEAWWRRRADSGVSEATRMNDLANLRSFYKWCDIWEHRHPGDNPTLRIQQPKVPNGLPRAMSRADLHRVLEHCRDAERDDLRRAVCLGAYAGLRVSEVAALTWPDVDSEGHRARILNSKGAKSRLVALSPLLIDQLLPDTGLNVVTGTGEPYSADQLQRKVNRAIRSAGVVGTFHQLRHRYGTIGYQATKDLVALQRQMGHSSPVTTAVYADAGDAAADQIAAAVVR